MTTFKDAREILLRHDYDPVKAREYYLRTRELKGREPGKQNPTPIRGLGKQTPRSIQPQGTKQLGVLKKRPTTPTIQERRAVIEERVKALQSRLEKLKAALAELVKQAKIRSGLDESDIDTKKTSADAKSDKDKKPQTAAEKREAKKRYEEEKKKQTPDQKVEQLQTEIKRVQEKIADARAKLKESMEKARSKAVVNKPALQRRATLRKDSQNGS